MGQRSQSPHLDVQNADKIPGAEQPLNTGVTTPASGPAPGYTLDLNSTLGGWGCGPAVGGTSRMRVRPWVWSSALQQTRRQVDKCTVQALQLALSQSGLLGRFLPRGTLVSSPAFPPHTPHCCGFSGEDLSSRATSQRPLPWPNQEAPMLSHAQPCPPSLPHVPLPRAGTHQALLTAASQDLTHSRCAPQTCGKRAE